MSVSKNKKSMQLTDHLAGDMGGDSHTLEGEFTCMSNTFAANVVILVDC